MLLNFAVREDSWESLGQKGDPTNQRRLLRVPWTERRSNQSVLTEISPEYSLEILMLKLELQYSGHLMQRTDSLEKTLIMGKIEGRRRSGWQQMRWLDGITDWMYMEFDGQGSLVCCTPWDCKKSNTTEQLNCTEQSKSQQFSYIQKYIMV